MPFFSDMTDEIRQKYAISPHKPGVYVFKNKDGKPLYIGKARDLKKRLASYIIGKIHERKIDHMLALARDLEWIITDNELEALILEANMIRKERPKYNVALKDDKRYPYLKITNETFPQILVTRNKIADGAQYFGPYADRIGASGLIKTIRRLFGVRHCSLDLPNENPKRPCLLADIGQCSAPCSEKTTQEEYRRLIDEATLFLRGKRTELIANLRKKMEQLAEDMRFEEAARTRDTVVELERILVRQKMDNEFADRDYITIAIGSELGVAVVFRMRQGLIIGRHNFTLSVPKEAILAETITEFLYRFYAEFDDVPLEILLPEKPADFNELVHTLSSMFGKKVEIKVPQRGDKYETLILAQKNAELLFEEINLQKKSDNSPFGVLELQKNLALINPPNRIEAFDISNFGGQTVVASMVQFVAARANKSEYRLFKIKSFSGQNDFAAMHEIVFRRYRRLIEENRTLPDLILIDGGKGQLSAAYTALSELELHEKVPLVSIAKRLDELFVPHKSLPISLPKDSAALRLLQRIRDEAHRFAVSFSRKKHGERLLELAITDVQGIGKARARALLHAFDSMEALKLATIEEICEKTKIPHALAEKLLEKITNDL